MCVYVVGIGQSGGGVHNPYSSSLLFQRKEIRTLCQLLCATEMTTQLLGV